MYSCDVEAEIRVPYMRFLRLLLASTLLVSIDIDIASIQVPGEFRLNDHGLKWHGDRNNGEVSIDKANVKRVEWIPSGANKRHLLKLVLKKQEGKATAKVEYFRGFRDHVRSYTSCLTLCFSLLTCRFFPRICG